MINKGISFLGFWVLCQVCIAQVSTNDDHTSRDTSPIISGVHTLSIHVRDTITHDSVFQFLVQQLGLPVYYSPVKYGEKKYVGLYAGNMVLEPCGPYPDNKYGTEDFRSIFFGINFEVHQSLAASKEVLGKLGLVYQDNQSSIYIRDRILCNESVFVALYEVNDKAKRSKLRNELSSNFNNKLGLEYIKEIHIGYKEESNFRRWKEFLSPLNFVENHICQVNDTLQLHFSREKINEVKGITFKVKSLKKAAQHLIEVDALESSGSRLLINQKQTFGLLIFLSDTQ